jgi:transposase
MHFIKPNDRHQSVIFGSLDNLVSSDHPVRIIDAIVSNIVSSNPAEFEHKGKQNIGRRSYSPKTMLKLFIYGYLNGISSSRKLEIETHRNIELKWLLGNLQPDHKTIANYRKENSKQIELLTIEFRKFLKSSGYIKGKRVALDGTKIKANTNRDMLTIEKIEKRMSRLEKELNGYIKKIADSDAREDVLDETDCLDDDSKNEVLVREVASLRIKIEALEKAKTLIVKSEKKHLSLSDPDASLMKGREGKMPAYNIQSVVDSENHMIAEARVSTAACDKRELVPTIKSLKEKTEIVPEELTADKGYYSPKEIQDVESNYKTTCFIPKEAVNNDIKFTYNQLQDVYICPLGKVLEFKHNKKKKGILLKMYQCKNCNGCPIRSKCTKSRVGRIVHRREDQEWCNNYESRIESEYAKNKICERKSIVEHAFGTIKYWMGQIPLLLRGRTKVQTEIDLYTTAYNLKRLTNIEAFDCLMKKISGHNWSIEMVNDSPDQRTPALNAICIVFQSIVRHFYTKHSFFERDLDLRIEY